MFSTRHQVFIDFPLRCSTFCLLGGSLLFYGLILLGFWGKKRKLRKALRPRWFLSCCEWMKTRIENRIKKQTRVPGGLPYNKQEGARRKFWKHPLRETKILCGGGLNFVPLRGTNSKQHCWHELFSILRDAVSKLETFVWILNHISRFIAWSLFTLKASYLVKWPIITREEPPNIWLTGNEKRICWLSSQFEFLNLNAIERQFL